MSTGSQQGAPSQQVLLATLRPPHTLVQCELACMLTLAQHGRISQFPTRGTSQKGSYSSTSSSFTSQATSFTPAHPSLPSTLLLHLQLSSLPNFFLLPLLFLHLLPLLFPAFLYHSLLLTATSSSISPLPSPKLHPRHVAYSPPPPLRLYKDGHPEVCRPAGTR